MLLAGFYFASCTNSSNDTANDSLAAKIERGDYLVNAVANCMHCHADRDFKKFSGPIDKLMTHKGLERISDEEAEEIIKSLDELAVIAISHIINSGITNKSWISFLCHVRNGKAE